MRRDPILITGCARSGTSMTAGIIDICGAYGGAVCGPTRYNRKGQFENNIIRQSIVKPFLRDELGVDPMGQHPLPRIEAVRHYVNQAGDRGIWLQTIIRKTFAEQGYTDGPWYYKGAKLCLIWPVWNEAFPESKWVIVRRDDSDIIKSCLRTGFMRAFNTPKGWQGWIDHHKERFTEMQERLQVREVWPKTFVNGDLSEIKDTVEWLGLTWNEDKVQEFIEPALWGARKNG